MTRRQALERARELLTRHKIEDAALEAELLLGHTLKITRTQLLTEADVELKKRQEDTFKTFVKRRIELISCCCLLVSISSRRARKTAIAF